MTRFGGLGLAAFFVAATGCTGVGKHAARSGASADTILVVQIKYFPIDGELIDIRTTGDWGESLAYTHAKVDSVSTLLRASLSEATRYHGYRLPEAVPSLVYEILETYASDLNGNAWKDVWNKVLPPRENLT